MDDHTNAASSPEHGAAPQPQRSTSPPGNGLATSSIVLGFLSLICSVFCAGFITAIPGLICGIKAKTKLKAAGHSTSKATAGIAMSIAGGIFTTIMVLTIDVIPTLVGRARRNAAAIAAAKEAAKTPEQRAAEQAQREQAQARREQDQARKELETRKKNWEKAAGNTYKCEFVEVIFDAARDMHVIEARVSSVWNSGYVNNARLYIATTLKRLHDKDLLDSKNINFVFSKIFTSTDIYGNTSQTVGKIFSFAYRAEDLSKVNWKDIEDDTLFDLAAVVRQYHPEGYLLLNKYVDEFGRYKRMPHVYLLVKNL